MKGSASHLSGGQIAGIAVGVTLAILLVIGSWHLVNRRRRKHTTAQSVEDMTEGKPFDINVTMGPKEYDGRDHRNELLGSVEIYQDPLRNGFGAGEIRGDLGGTELHGDSGAFELSGSDASVRTR